MSYLNTKNSQKQTRTEKTSIAIIGLGCWLPGASTARQLWENVLSRRQEFRRMPDVRTPLSDYFDPEGKDPDRYYQSKVAVIDGFDFDRASYRIPENTYVRTDMCQWLALEIANRALEDAGITKASAPRDRTGVFVGNTCTGEGMRSNVMRLRWPVVERALSKAAELHGISGTDVTSFMKTTEDCYKSIFPEITEDFVAGGISATIAGRICNHFDFHGGAFVIDGACASSLTTVVTAANMLASKDLDMALAGGVDISLDPFELVGFSRNGALSKDMIRPYDRRGAGFIAGEGGGLVVMKRLEDAQRDGDFIYATLRGWGLSSDGRAGIMQPVAKQQAAAIQRAVAGTGCKLADLDFVEGHGTGTRAGDRTEVEGMSLAMALENGNHNEQDGDPQPERTCGIGSLKSIIGHTKAAAGVASLIKAVAAVNRRVVPPTASVEEPNNAFDGVGKRLFPIRFGEARGTNNVVRAGVSAFGFGGINTHLIIESGETPSPKLAPDVDEKALLASYQTSELFVFAGNTKEELLSRVRSVETEAPSLSQSDLVDLAASLAKDLPPTMPFRAAVIATSADDLTNKLSQLHNALGTNASMPDNGWAKAHPDIYIAHGTTKGRIGFMFPGQGSQQLSMARTLIERYEWARQLADEAQRAVGNTSFLDTIFKPVDRARNDAELSEWQKALSATEVAQPAICLASVLCARYLQTIGIEPVAVGGHSLGEITALHAAGAFNTETLFSTASLRGTAMQAKPNQPGAMASLACSSDEARSILSEISQTVVIANINAPNQTVVSGEARAIDAVVEIADTRNITCHRLPVSNAFHSPLMDDCAQSFGSTLNLPSSTPSLRIPILSGIEAISIDNATDLHLHLTRQIKSPVNFVNLALGMKGLCDVLIEVGPGRILSGLCRNIFDNEDMCTPLASDAMTWNPNPAVAVAFANNADINWDAFYAQRLVRPYVRPSQRTYLSNPAERPVDVTKVSAPQHTNGLSVAPNGTSVEGTLSNELGLDAQDLTGYLQRRGEFLAGVVKLDMTTVQKNDNVPEPAFTQQPQALTHVETVVTQVKETPSASITANTNGQLDISGLLISLVSERTGYPESSIAPTSRLLDDLNLDSIKAGELVAEAAKRVDAAGAIDATKFANASLEEIAAALAEVAPKQAAAPAPTSITAPAVAPAPVVAEVTTTDIAPPQDQAAAATNGATNPTSDGIAAMLICLISERTGYPESSMTVQSRLLDDLNLDSIKAGELVAEASKRVDAAGAIDATKFANASLEEIAAALAEVAPKQAAAPAPTAAPAVACAPVVTEVTTTDATPPQGQAAAANNSDGNPTSDSVAAMLISLISERTGYPESSMTVQSRLLDDLNLDSIKAGELVAEISRRVGVAGAIDATKFSNASITEISAAVIEVVPKASPAKKAPSITPPPSAKHAAPPSPQPKQTPPQPKQWPEGDLSFTSRHPTWTRNYVVHAELAPREDTKAHTPADLKGMSFLIIHEVRDREPSEALASEVIARGASVERITFDAAYPTALQQGRDYTHKIAILPRTAGTGTPAQRVSEMASRMTAFCQPPAASTNSAKPQTTVAYVQFGGGTFGSDGASEAPELSATLAFSRTLHLERDDLRVRVVDFAKSTELRAMAKMVLDEIDGEEPFHAVGFDANLTRHIPTAHLSEPTIYKPRDVTWSDRDVILVTGGAKGIMAECSLGLARDTGSTLVLVGRGKPILNSGDGGDAEITKTLERFRAEGLKHHYLSCDITDRDALENAVRQIEQDVGPISGIVHGASILRPTKTDNLTKDGLLQEVSPKVLGAWNLCDVFCQKRIKLFVTFSSLVVDHGMPWSAGYSFANEAMERIVQTYAASSDQPIPLQIVSYGLWGAVGRPADLKTNDHLLSVGLHDGEIPPEEGVRRLVDVFRFDPGVQRVCIYGRSVGYGPWDALRPKQSVPSDLRFIENVAHLEPEVELVARCHLTLQRDQYLHDHVYNGMYIVPTVLALEIIAQAATAVAGTDLPLVRLDSVEMPAPLIVDPTTGLELELHAEVQEKSAPDQERRVNVSITTDKTGFKTIVLSGTVAFGQRRSEMGKPLALKKPLTIDARADLYGRQFFVGATYQRMGPIFSVNKSLTVCTGEIHTPSDAARDAFNNVSGGGYDTLVIGDPFYRDTLLHTSLLHHLDHMAFTSRIDRIELFEGCEANGTDQRVCISRLQWSKDKDAEYELVSASPNGKVYERWTGFCSKALTRQSDWPKLQDLLELDRAKTCDEHQLLEAIADAASQLEVTPPTVALDCVRYFSDFPIEERHAHERTLAERAAANLTPETSSDIGLNWQANGRPQLDADTGLDISFSHEGWYCLCAVGSDAQGCDLATISPRSQDDWHALFGSERKPLLDTLSGDEELDVAGTRIWAALEAARKVYARDDVELSIVKRSGTTVLVRATTQDEDLLILTLPLRFSHGAESIVALKVQKASHTDAANSGVSTELAPAAQIVHDEALGCDVLQYEFNVSWKDCASLSRKPMAACYVDWFHRAREAMLSPQDSRKWVTHVLDGTAGLVARSVRVHIHNEATAHDQLCARIWMTELSESTATWRLEFSKKMGSGEPQKLIATVEAEGRIVKASLNGAERGVSQAMHDYKRFTQTKAVKPQPFARSVIKDLPRGKLHFEVPTGPQSGPLLFVETITPSLIDSDLVGNISSIKFFEWMAHIRDRFLYTLAPKEMVRRNGVSSLGIGEPVCVHEEMSYLREAFPFDTITGEMRLVSASEHSAKIAYEFMRQSNDTRKKEKIAIGHQELVWVHRDEAGGPLSTNFPSSVVHVLNPPMEEFDISQNAKVG